MTTSSPPPVASPDRATLRHGTRLPDLIARLAGGALVALAAVALLVPVGLVIVLSFSNETKFLFPPEEWGFRQYETLVAADEWRNALVYSIKVAIPVVALSTAIALPAVFAIRRSKLPARNVLQAAAMSSLVIPISAYAVAMYGVFAQIGLLGSYIGLVIAHTVLALPLVLVVVSAAMSRIPIELEFAAMTAGASRPRAWAGITLRLLVPALLAGGVLAFVTSLDEAVFINFLSGAGQTTLPKAIFNSVRFGIDPVITAIATILIVCTSVLMIVAMKLGAKRDDG